LSVLTPPLSRLLSSPRPFPFPAPAPPDIYTLSLHDALPISQVTWDEEPVATAVSAGAELETGVAASTGYNGYDESGAQSANNNRDRKSTRLNSSHVSISYAVFCLKKKKKKQKT